LSSIFLYSLDNTVVADITPTAVNTFGDVLKLPWLSVGYVSPFASRFCVFQFSLFAITIPFPDPHG
jgi:hypothetical protein